MTKLLMNEAPIIIIPSLAVKIGLKESIVLQQIHYWLQSSSHVFDGQTWIYNTYEEWLEQFPFWSKTTLKRTVYSLESKGLIVSSNWNKRKNDKTKWYTIDYQLLEELEQQDEPSEEQSDVSERNVEEVNLDLFADQIGTLDVPERNAEDTILNSPLPESTSETTTENTNPIVDIVDYLNAKTNANYKSTTKKTKQLIKARLKEGFTLEDFKRVIDLKTEKWLPDPQMNQFLRPETLFGNKFESYLNQKPIGKDQQEKARQIPVHHRTYNEEDFELYD